MAWDSNSVALLNQLQGILSPEVLEALRQGGGNCQATFSHRGAVELPGLTITKDGDIYFGIGGGGVNGNLTITNPQRETTIVRKELVIMGMQFWSVAQAVPREVNDPRFGGNRWWVSCNACSDMFKGGLRGPAFDVLCVTTGGNTPDIDVGDLVLYCWMPKDMRAGNASGVRVWQNNYQTPSGGNGGSSSSSNSDSESVLP